MSRKLSKAERKLQRKAMFALANRGSAERSASDESVKTLEALGAWKPEEVPTPPSEEPSAPKRIRRLLETSAAELEQAEIEVLDELLAAAREGIALYKAEARARTEAQQRGEPITTRWQVAPGVFEKITGRVIRIIEIKIRRRRDLSRDRKQTALAG
jgi:hypothetical protein